MALTARGHTADRESLSNPRVNVGHAVPDNPPASQGDRQQGRLSPRQKGLSGTSIPGPWSGVWEMAVPTTERVAFPPGTRALFMLIHQRDTPAERTVHCSHQ